MIGKIKRGTSFRGVLAYNFDPKKKSQIIGGNMAGSTPRELSSEFGAVRRLRPSLGVAVEHFSISLALGEHLSDDEWRHIVDVSMRSLGFTDNQFVIFKHHDTEHEHIHVVTNRIRMNGSAVDSSHDFQKLENALRKLEKELGLQQVIPSRESQKRAPTKGEIEGAIRTGLPSTKMQMQHLLDSILPTAKTMRELVDTCELAGLEVIPRLRKNDTELSGLSYRIDGVTMKASDLGKKYSPLGLAKTDIHYEKDRDLERLSQCIKREQDRITDCPDRDIANNECQVSGGISVLDRASGVEPDKSHGRSEINTGIHPEQGRSPIQGIGGSSQVGSPSGQPDSKSDSSPEPQGLGDRPGDRGDFESARQRIAALGVPATPYQQLSEPRPSTSGRNPASVPRPTTTPASKPDRTLAAVEKQIMAMDCDFYEIGMRNAKSGKFMNRRWSKLQILDALSWLKRQNAKGEDIYIKPGHESGLIIVDDLNADSIHRMRHDRFNPAALIETSPNNYQAWVKISDTPLPKDVRKAIALHFAKEYEGDKNSVDASHFGRLAGFTNRKPKHERDGRSPYVLAHECPGKIASAAPALLAEVVQGLSNEAQQAESVERLDAIQREPDQARYGRDAGQEYKHQARQILDKYPVPDLSRLDFMVAKSLLKQGYSVEIVQRAILENSPSIEARKPGHEADYANRTVHAALMQPDVQAHIKADALASRHYHGISR
jgi:hypothetical protein